MDSLSSLVQPLFQYWYIYLVIAVFIFFRSPRGKGLLGEFEINLLTRLFLDKKIYRLIKDVTIPAGKGTTQIDHIVVSRYGVFVVETKNMRGWIFGGEKQQNWTQKIFKHATTFQNPLRQNYKHTMALAELIGLDPKKIFSVIVFIGESTFKTPMPENVTQGMQYIRYIKAQQTALLGKHEVSELVSRIEERRLLPSRKTDKQHVEYLRSSHSNPATDQKLSLEKAKRRQFLIVFSGITLTAVLILVFTQPERVKELPGKLNAVIQEFSTNKHQRSTSSEPKDYNFSEDQVKSAMEEVLRDKIDQSDTAQEGTPEQPEPRYQFEIQLHTGAKIYTDNAEIRNDTVSYSSKNGLIISVNREEIKTMKRVLKK
jgi:restriction system protein